MALPYSDIFSLLDWNSRYSVTTSTDDGPIDSTALGALADANTASSVFLGTNAKYSIGPIGSTPVGLTLTADGSTTFTDAPVLATYRLPTTVSATFTFEFDLSLSASLPANFADKDNRVFVGAINRSGYTCGFLFSSDGIGLCSSPYAEYEEITVLQGSAAYLFNYGEPKTSVTIRGAVDGDTGVVSIYITDTDLAYTGDITYGSHILR